jgi:hypothetical protein
MKAMRYKITLLSLLSVPAMLLVAISGSAAAAPHRSAAGAPTAAVTSSSLGSFKPTFVGSAATGCAGCHLLTGPISTPSTAHLSSQSLNAHATSLDRARAMPLLRPHVPVHGNAPTVRIPTVSCVPLRPGCDNISPFAGGSSSAKGINAVDSATMKTNVSVGDVEPPDQGLCAGNGNVVETNNIGEILIFNKALKRVSPVIPLDTLMGLTQQHWSSGGDPSCVWDPANGGHWFFTQIVSASPESKGGPFAGCFISGPKAVANSCMEGIAVTKGSSPFGPYNVYFLHANYNPKEPGAPFLLNDFAKIAATRDAFLLFYDDFPLNTPGLGGGFFNGAQQFAFNKSALEKGLPVAKVTVARENMGLLKTPNGTCFSDNKLFLPGIACWFSVIPAMPGNGQFDNSHGGSGFMLATVDPYALGGNQLAVFDWTGLKNLNSGGCSACSGIRFGGQLFSGVQDYYNPGNTPSGILAPQKAGPIPLGNECHKALLGGVPLSTVRHCPLAGIATNSDQVTQASQGNGQLWTGVSTTLVQTYASTVQEQHMGAAYWAVGTRSFDQTGKFALTSQGYISPMHEDLEFPAFAAGASNGRAIVSFTLNGNGGLAGADNGGFFPSSAFGRVTSTSGTLLSSTVNIAALGQSPQDGFTQYLNYPSATFAFRPRWGDYGGAIVAGGKAYFASEYIQSPNCAPPAFRPNAFGVCGGTRNGLANWGTSVNSVTP